MRVCYCYRIIAHTRGQDILPKLITTLKYCIPLRWRLFLIVQEVPTSEAGWFFHMLTDNHLMAGSQSGRHQFKQFPCDSLNVGSNDVYSVAHSYSSVPEKLIAKSTSNSAQNNSHGKLCGECSTEWVCLHVCTYALRVCTNSYVGRDAYAVSTIGVWGDAGLKNCCEFVLVYMICSFSEGSILSSSVEFAKFMKQSFVTRSCQLCSLCVNLDICARHSYLEHNRLEVSPYLCFLVEPSNLSWVNLNVERTMLGSKLPSDLCIQSVFYINGRSSKLYVLRMLNPSLQILGMMILSPNWEWC